MFYQVIINIIKKRGKRRNLSCFLLLELKNSILPAVRDLNENNSTGGSWDR